MRAALIHASSGKVINVLELPDGDVDPQDAYTPPPGHRTEPDPDGKASIGGHFTDGTFVAPPTPDPVVDPAASIEPAVVTAEDALVAMFDKMAGGGTLTTTEKGAIPDLAVKALGGRAKVDRLRRGAT